MTYLNVQEPLWSALDSIENFETPDLDDLLTYDFTEPQYERIGDTIYEFDLMEVECEDGIRRTGTLINYTDDYIVISVDGDIFRVGMALANITATLIAHADEDALIYEELDAYIGYYDLAYAAYAEVFAA